MNVQLSKIDYNLIKSLSIRYFNSRHYGKPGYRINERSSKHILDRLCVNYIRHNLTNYNEIMGGNKPRHEVLMAIAKEYPMLKDECQRQINFGY